MGGWSSRFVVRWDSVGVMSAVGTHMCVLQRKCHRALARTCPSLFCAAFTTRKYAESQGPRLAAHQALNGSGGVVV